MTEERRKEVSKDVKKKGDNAKVAPVSYTHLGIGAEGWNLHREPDKGGYGCTDHHQNDGRT